MPDPLSAHYQDLLASSYDCVDRIVLNAYFRLGMTPGGFRYWWQPRTGSEEQLDNEHWMRMAGRFSRRVRAYAKAHQNSGEGLRAGGEKAQNWRATFKGRATFSRGPSPTKDCS
jgi:hypothetical protein